MMSSSTVTLTAEWARWGMHPSERGGYHLLACSEGRISPRNFTEILDRFNPGNLDDLPQVTISYVPAGDSGYLGLAIHEPEASGTDRLGTDVTFTRYFCVPYQEAASATVSYVAMYEAFRGIQPAEGDRSVLTVESARGMARQPADLDRALPVAGLLFTGNPVCIVGAETTEMTERLAYIDAVMSLLPYGMRAQMAASTWTMGTYRAHKFRLFFSEAPRRSASGLDDHVVRWHSDQMLIGEAPDTKFPAEPADEYTTALRQRLGRPVVRLLAEASEPTPFTAQAPIWALDLIQVLDTDRPALSGEAGRREPSRQREGPADSPTSRAPRGQRAPQAADPRLVREYLLACLRAVGDGDASKVKRQVGQLEEVLHRAELPDAEQRQRVHDIFGASPRLVRELAMGSQRAALYEFLLRLSLSRTIDYQGYCLVEEIIDGRPNRPLLDAISERAADDPILQVLISDQAGIRRPLRDLRQLIELAVAPDIRPDHARLICRLLLGEAGAAGVRDIKDVLPSLREHGYLAPALAAREPEDLRYQVETLVTLLAAVFPKSPDHDPYPDILTGSGKHAPTAALLLAVLCLTQGTATDVGTRFMAGLARVPGLSDDVRAALTGKGVVVGAAEDPVRLDLSTNKRVFIAPPGSVRRPSARILRRVPNPSSVVPADPGDADERSDRA